MSRIQPNTIAAYWVAQGYTDSEAIQIEADIIEAQTEDEDYEDLFNAY